MRYRIWGALFTLGLIVSTSASAVSNEVTCKPVDLRPQFGPVRNQQSTGWCFAFSLADLLGQKLQIKPPEMVSAREIATTFVSLNSVDRDMLAPQRAQEIGGFVDRNFQGVRLDRRHAGHPIFAFEAYKTRGRMCLESQYPSQDLRYSTNWLNRQVDNFYQARNLSSDPIMPKPSKDEILNCYLKPGLNNQVSDVQKTINNMATQEIRREMDEICPTTDRLKDLTPVQKFHPKDVDRTELELMGQTALDQGQGFIVDYDVNYWKSPLKLKIDNDGGIYSVEKYAGGRHASVVVGRRWNEKTSQCELLIRNSWGPSCGYYREGVECEDGHFWVSSKELFERTHAVFKF